MNSCKLSGRNVFRQALRKGQDVLKSSVRELKHPDDQPHRIVHNCRQSIKIARSLLRLVRHGLASKDYHRLNFQLRNASRPLAAVRDAKVVLDSFNELIAISPHHLPVEQIDRLRRRLELRLEDTWQKQIVSRQAFGQLEKRLRRCCDRWKGFKHQKCARSDLERGIRRVYDAGRQQSAMAGATPSLECLHEWRKQSKHLRYQLEFLSAFHGSDLSTPIEELKDLGNRLGQIRDYSILRSVLEEVELPEIPSPLCAELVQMASARMDRELESVLANGRVVYGPTPKEMMRRLAFWRMPPTGR